MENTIINANSIDYFTSGECISGCEGAINAEEFKTGIAPIDDIQPFYPGLYVLGAMPGMGKTTLALQIADKVAASGRSVLY